MTGPVVGLTALGALLAVAGFAAADGGDGSQMLAVGLLGVVFLLAPTMMALRVPDAITFALVCLLLGAAGVLLVSATVVGEPYDRLDEEYAPGPVSALFLAATVGMLVATVRQVARHGLARRPPPPAAGTKHRPRRRRGPTGRWSADAPLRPARPVPITDEPRDRPSTDHAEDG